MQLKPKKLWQQFTKQKTVNERCCCHTWMEIHMPIVSETVLRKIVPNK